MSPSVTIPNIFLFLQTNPKPCPLKSIILVAFKMLELSGIINSFKIAFFF